MNIARYNKLIVAVVGLVVIVLKDRTGIDLSAAEGDLVNAIVGIVTAVAVYAVPNAPAK